ncbi:hypothetical protein [Lachnoclostridium phytofermentans]|uniref:hypothetical protein n=1 Tax=Lachnoclostridium phytofermentans TaxID=66219 RepID=UPI000495BE9E|nr:hypothetical protein [Lachnoclostridium phytofermentans]
MHRKNGIEKLSIIELLTFISWCVIVLVFADYDRAGFYFWGGFGFGFISYVVAGVSLLLIKKNNNRNTTEISYIPVYYTAVYLLVSVIINTYFVFRVTGKLNVVLVVLNLVIFVAFISIRLYTDGFVARVDVQTRHSADKIRPITSISSQLAIMLSVTTDSDIKKQLLKLKEIVDYSSNVSQEFSENSQKLFLLQLNQIQSLIVEHKDKDEINKKIQEATATWKTRNSVVSTIN